MQNVTRRLILGFPLALPLMASRWDETPFPDWDQKFIDRMLTDSPWAHPWRGTAILPPADQKKMMASFSQIGIGLPSPIPGVGRPRLPGTGGPLPREDSGPAVVRMAVDLTIRWASALPVRRALALQEFGRQGLNQERAEALTAARPEEFVIELAGIPHQLASSELRRDLSKARLSVASRRPVTPVSVDIPAIGREVTAKLRFPRIDDLSPDAGSIDLLAESGSLRIEERFKLRAMIYRGQLEL